MSRLTWCPRPASGWLGGGCLLLAVAGAATAEVEVAPDLRAEVVVVGVPRPVQIALDGSGHLVILSHGWRGDAAAELYRFELAALPLDASRAPRMVVPFSPGPRKAAFGSLALDPHSGDLFMGEENGNRVYRLSADTKLALFGVGLNNLLGGSSLAFDRDGRLVVLDYTSPEEEQQRSETPPPASFEGLGGNAYHGPVVIRLDPREDLPLPRRLDLIPPFFPVGAAIHFAGSEPLFRFISVAMATTAASQAAVLLDSVGQLFVLGSDGLLRPLARLPSGHYHRTHMAVGPDGSVFVSSGFQIRQIFRVSPTGVVTVVARDLGDPEGIAVDEDGDLYVAENALHRIIRIRAAVRPPPASPR
jgi:sugar lactone lactonase YvrE